MARRKGKRSPKMPVRNGRASDLNRKVVVGATGVAITAGLIAAGAALANKRIRQRLTHGAQKAADTIGKLASNLEESAARYPTAVAHRVSSTKRGRKRTRRSS